MKDRVSTNPGRVLITPEDGSSAFYAVLSMADEPTVPGDPLNKATFLKDETAALFGLGNDAVPDGAFSKIAESLGGFKVVNSYQITPDSIQFVQIDISSFSPDKFYYLRMYADGVDTDSTYMLSYSATASGPNTYLDACKIDFRNAIIAEDNNYYSGARLAYNPKFLVKVESYIYPDETVASSFIHQNEEYLIRWVGIRTKTTNLKLSFSCTNLNVGTVTLELMERAV